MRKLTDEERALAEELFVEIRKRRRRQFEIRLNAEFGPKYTSLLIGRIDEMLKKEMGEEDIIKALRNDPTIRQPDQIAAVGVLANSSIYGYVMHEIEPYLAVFDDSN